MTISADTPIVGPADSTLDQFIAYVSGCQRNPDAVAYGREIYRLAPLVNINPTVLVSQAAHETSIFRSFWWRNRLNPAGIGITGDPAQDAASGTWTTGTDAARAQLVHMAAYALGDTGVRKSPLKDFIESDPRYPAVLQAGYGGTVRVLGDLGSGVWATDPDYAAGIVKHANAILAMQGDTPMDYSFGNVIHPDYEDNFIPKTEGTGWDNLGKRTVDGVTWHRILGGLRGTEVFFSDPSVGALTDYGVGVLAQDGAGDDGTICRWNDPLGWRSGWASGPVSAPYGDGVLFVNKYGRNAVNSQRASIEISGFQDTPLSPKARAAVVAITAYWADQKNIPWDVWPVVPEDGFSFVCWHREFTIGTGKLCPFDAVIAETDAMIEDVRAVLKQGQTVAAPTPAPKPAPTPTPAPKPTPAPEPQYATPIPPPEFTGADVLDTNQKAWVAAKHTYKVVTDAPRLRTANRNSPSVGPVIKAGITFSAPWQVHGGRFVKTDARPEAEMYAVTERGSRIPLGCCEVVK